MYKKYYVFFVIIYICTFHKIASLFNVPTKLIKKTS